MKPSNLIAVALLVLLMWDFYRPAADAPPVDPVTDWQVVMVYESADLGEYPPGQQAVLKSLAFREDLESAGHKLLPGGVADDDVVDPQGKPPNRLEPFLRAAASVGKPLPLLTFAPLAGGKVRVAPLPADEDAVLAMLGGTDG